MRKEPAPDRFWRKVAKGGPDECWLWLGELNGQGYARFVLKHTPERVRVLGHRYAYELVTGEDITGFFLLHSCDNPPCVNPAHLRPGTQADNIRDAVERGRFNRRGLDESRARRSARVQERLRTGIKFCPDCDQTKPLDAFHLTRRNPDGRSPICAECRNSYEREKRARIRRAA